MNRHKISVVISGTLHSICLRADVSACPSPHLEALRTIDTSVIAGVPAVGHTQTFHLFHTRQLRNVRTTFDILHHIPLQSWIFTVNEVILGQVQGCYPHRKSVIAPHTDCCNRPPTKRPTTRDHTWRHGLPLPSPVTPSLCSLKAVKEITFAHERFESMFRVR